MLFVISLKYILFKENSFISVTDTLLTNVCFLTNKCSMNKRKGVDTQYNVVHNYF